MEPYKITISRLEDWSIVRMCNNKNSTNPDFCSPYDSLRLCGKEFGHPNHEDGWELTTAIIVSADSNEGHIVTANGEKYILGEVDKEYDKFYPDAKEVIFKEFVSERHVSNGNQ